MFASQDFHRWKILPPEPLLTDPPKPHLKPPATLKKKAKCMEKNQNFRPLGPF
jgi:hypothetical protein